MADSSYRVAVLVSGGLDSAVLVGDLANQGREVWPLFVRAGLQWEEQELAHLRKFLAAIVRPNLHELVVLHQPVSDLYGEHWSLTGEKVPDAESPDAAVYLPGRNLLLLLQGLLWCHLHHVPRIALAVLKGNPFPDASGAFFDQFAAAVNLGVGDGLKIERPYAGLSKAEVVARGAALPLQWTLSCLQPQNGVHCGACNKCAERRKAFRAAGVLDPTQYARVTNSQ
jgi:7-cyano-7-deazaguanine synthase